MKHPVPKKKTLSLAVCLLVPALAAPAGAWADTKLKIDDTRWFSVGAGLRTSFNSVEDGAPNGTDRSKDVEVDNIRLYTAGQVHQNAKLTFNTERQSDSTVRVLDAIAQLEFSDMFNVWLGRFLPPSDRSLLDGPYYLATWDFPFVQNYPALFAGRDDGVAAWGQTGGGKFKYQVGAFQGRDGPGTSNQSDSLLYAGRLTWNFWDPEPGYYNASTYYGAKEILALGLVAMSQSDGAGTAATPGDFTGWSVDALMEKRVGGDVLSVEAAYYDYDLDGVADASLVQGEGFFVYLGYLIGAKTGAGKFQPHVRYQKLEPDGAVERTRYDVGVNYVIAGHDARLSLIYADDDRGALPDAKILRVGVQLQI